MYAPPIDGEDYLLAPLSISFTFLFIEKKERVNEGETARVAFGTNVKMRTIVCSVKTSMSLYALETVEWTCVC